MSQMKELKTSFENEMRDMREQVRHDMVEEFDQRRFGTDGFFETQRVIQKMEELHGNMITSINDRMAQGIAGVAVDAGAAMGGGEVSGNELFWRDEEDPPELEMEGGEGEAPVGGEEAPVVHREYSLHWRGSRIGRTPEGFVMPSMTLSGLITCWFLGNREEKIVPFRFLKATDMTGEKKKNKKILSNMKRLMKLVTACGEQEGLRGLSQRRTADWNVGATVDLYHSVKKYFEYSGNIGRSAARHDSRHKQLTWKTTLNTYLRKGKRFANEL